MTEISRPMRYVREWQQQYPRAWRRMRELRAQKGAILGDWPDYCWLPIVGGHAIATGGRAAVTTATRLIEGRHGAILTALGTWRITQGIYRFDEALYKALMLTPVTQVPCELLRHLPEWCVYIETPRFFVGATVIFGFWAHMEWDVNHGHDEIRFVLDVKGGPIVPMPLHLEDRTLDECLERTSAFADLNIHTQYGLDDKRLRDHNQMTSDVSRKILPSLLSLTLYLCSERPDISGGNGEFPRRPQPVRTKRGEKWLPPQTPLTWDVGIRIGAAIRKNTEPAEPAEPDPEGGRHSPRPHVRRAHWKTYWTGPGRRTPVLRWLAPTLVGTTSEELPTVVRPVPKEE